MQRYHDFDAARTEQFNQERHEQEAKLEVASFPTTTSMHPTNFS